MGLQVKAVYPDMRPLPLYSYGDENIPITGGWVPGYKLDAGGQSKHVDELYLYISNNGVGVRTYVTDKPVKLDGLNNIVVNWKLTGLGTAHAVLVASTNKDGSYAVYDRKVSINGYFCDGERGESSVDVSTLYGEYYIRVHVYKTAEGRPQAPLYIYEVRGEI